MKFLKVIIAVCVLTGMASCDYDDQCRKDRYVRLQAGFYKTTRNTTTGTITVSAVSLYNLSLEGLGSDSILYDKDTLSSVIMPLKKFDTQTKFRITWGSLSDTITILHTNTDTYVSLECGCIKTYVLDSVYSTKHFIDSIKISLKDVNATTSAKENIKIYNKTVD